MNGYKLWITAACGLFLAGNLPARADMADIESADRIATEASVAAGYRGISVHGDPGRAREYDSLDSSPLFNTRFFTDQGAYNLDFSLDYLNEDDYTAEAHLDTKGLLRLDLRSERFFHNLEHIPYDNGYTSTNLPASVTPRSQTGPPAEGSRPDGYGPSSATTPRVFYTDHDSDDEYGIRLDTNEAKLKIKCPDYPAHLNLSYWRYEKTGERQLRFLSEGSSQQTLTPPTSTPPNCTGCHMQSTTRDIDRITEEVKAGVDAHAGFIDLAIEALLRTFRDREPIPVDYFGAHGRGRLAGDYEHSEDPESKLKELTVRVNTAPSGGFVASASFTLGERENRSGLSSIAPVDAETDYYKTAADVTFTPDQNLTFNLRYRLLDMDSDNTGVLTNYGNNYISSDGYAPGTGLAVRDSLDFTRAWYEAAVSYRPSTTLTLKAELRREDIDRDGTGPFEEHHSPRSLPGIVELKHYWELPDEEIITHAKFGFNSRWLTKSALKINGWVSLKRNDDPAYGTSSSESKELFLSANYNPGSTWGALASLNLLDEENDDHEYQQSDTANVDLDRKRRHQNVSLGAWVAPREDLSFDINYGYLRTSIDQDLLFGAGTATTGGVTYDYAIENEGVDYRQTVQNVTVGTTWTPLKAVSCRLEGYHIRSKANFSPDFPTANYLYGSALNRPGTASSADLHDISKVDIRQNGLRGRVNWQIDDHLSCAVEATFDDYDEKGNDVFDGSVQSYMASLSYTF